jgi:hypothetical protein
MKRVFTLFLVLVVFALLSFPSLAAVSRNSLTIILYPQGLKGKSSSKTLSCLPSGGSLSNPTEACLYLAHHLYFFHPRPNNLMCADIYGGPQVAIIRGVWHGEKVRRQLDRINGCEIHNWQDAHSLVSG